MGKEVTLWRHVIGNPIRRVGPGNYSQAGLWIQMPWDFEADHFVVEIKGVYVPKPEPLLPHRLRWLKRKVRRANS